MPKRFREKETEEAEERERIAQAYIRRQKFFKETEKQILGTEGISMRKWRLD